VSKFYDALTPEIAEFIQSQTVFFTATAPEEGRINLSPKGMDTFRVLDPGTVAYLDITGSGNETATHLHQNGRITLMFCSFGAVAEIVRIYGEGYVVRPGNAEWEDLHRHFPTYPGERQIMKIAVNSAMTSCGYGVPRMELVKPRETLENYWIKKGPGAAEKYWAAHNVRSIDGLETGSFDDASKRPHPSSGRLRVIPRAIKKSQPS
jgi:Pyridoxamine 5'-phosphate oxidase